MLWSYIFFNIMNKQEVDVVIRPHFVSTGNGVFRLKLGDSRDLAPWGFTAPIQGHCSKSSFIPTASLNYSEISGQVDFSLFEMTVSLRAIQNCSRKRKVVVLFEPFCFMTRASSKRDDFENSVLNLRQT